MPELTIAAPTFVPGYGALRFGRQSAIIRASARRSPLMPRRTRPLDERSALVTAAAPAVDASAEACRQLLSEQLDVVSDAVRFVAARHHLTRDTADELRSRVMLHLTLHDYAVLRQWRRECSLHTYLVTVITRVFLDYRNQEWGKAKPPALARRLGPVAMLLWRLTHRKRLSFDEAVQTLHADHGVTASRDELWEIFSKLPAASGRYFVDVSELAHAEQPGADADGLVAAAERQALATRVDAALADALAGLASEDRLILKLFFTDGLSRAQIARLLQLDQQRLYPRFLALMQRLQAALTAHEVSAADVRQVIGAVELPVGAAALEVACKNDGPGPSLQNEGAPPPGRRPRPSQT